jgi:hypothetical protein
MPQSTRDGRWRVARAFALRICFLRANRSHAPCEERSKCLDLSRFYIADVSTLCLSEGVMDAAGVGEMRQLHPVDNTRDVRA